MSDITSLDEVGKFVSAPPLTAPYLGHILVFRVSDMSKSCFLRADFSIVTSECVFLPELSVGVPLSDKRKLSVPGCPLLEGRPLLDLYNKLLVDREIVNFEGQILIRLLEPIKDQAGVVVSDFVKCADVFLWSKFGGCDSLKLWPRYQFCTRNLVDEPQKKLDGLTDVVTAKEVQDLRDRVIALTAERDNLATQASSVALLSENSALKLEVSRLKAQVSQVSAGNNVTNVNADAKTALQRAGFTNLEYFGNADKSAILEYMANNYSIMKDKFEREQKESNDRFEQTQAFRYLNIMAERFDPYV
uniref:p34 n=1 Tax=Indian peanut clump virus D TaxID=119104 RepID=Q8B101_9VIRU|nr:P34 [Indian peanut clump virus D]